MSIYRYGIPNVINKNLTINGDLTVTGTFYLGDAAADSFTMGSATADCGTFTMIKGAQTSDPQVQFALSADANGDFSITADTGDITLIAADDIFFSADGAIELALNGTNLYPQTTDGLVLGSATNMFSDLFLASGGVINWDNGNVTLTHSTGGLALASGATTTDVFAITASALSTGSILSLTGTSGATAGITDALVKSVSNVGNCGVTTPTFGLYSLTATINTSGATTDTGVNLYLSTVNSNTTNANTTYGIYNVTTDAIVLANTNYGSYTSVTNTGAIDTAITKTVYGNYISAVGTGGAPTIAGTTNVYGQYITTTATHAANFGTVNQYGLYIANGTSSTNGTSSKYGLYIEAPAGADTNVGIYNGGTFLAGLGSSTLPAYSFIGDNNTGFYSNAADSMVAVCGGSTGFVVVAGLLQTPHLRTPSAAGMLITGNSTDGATAYGVKLGNANALTTAGATICGFYSDNVSTLKAYVSKDGTFGSVLGAVTLGVGATTFAAAGNVMTITGDAGGNTIATITAGVTGQILVLKFVDALVTITDDATSAANTINLSAAFTSSANDILTLMFDGTSWREIARSVN